MNVDSAINLLGYGFSLVPVHRPVVDRDGLVSCSCKRGSDCPSIGKHPIPPAWTDVASRKPDSVKAWWKALKSPNAGVVTGKVSGVVVLDIDPRHNGNESLDEMQSKNGKLPDTAMVITGSGGAHYYFKHPGASVKNATNVGGMSGIDFRGDGGFVVSPGSLHLSGCYYDWEASSTPEDSGFAEMPKWLFDLVFKQPSKRVEESTVGEAIVEGGRNVWLASLAGAIRRKGCGYKPILAALHWANQENCRPPLTTEEVQQIARSISRYAPG